MGFSNPVTSVDVVGPVDLAPGSTVGLDPGGTVDLTGGTQSGIAGQIQSAGAPPIDQETRLQAQVAPGSGLIGTYDISKLNSISAQMIGAGTGAAGLASYFTFTFYSAANTASPQPAEKIDVFSVQVDTTAYAELPALGNCVQVTVTGISGGFPKFAMSGGTRLVVRKTVYFTGGASVSGMSATTQQFNDDNSYSIVGNILATQTCTVSPRFKAGPVQLTISVGGGTATHNYLVSDTSGNQMASGTFVGGGAPVRLTLVFPRKPVSVNVTNNEASATRTFTIVAISQDA